MSTATATGAPAQGSRRGTVAIVALLLGAAVLVALLAPGKAHPT